MSLQNENSINEYSFIHQVRNEPLVFTINEFPEKNNGGYFFKFPPLFALKIFERVGILEEKSKEYNKMTTTIQLIRHSKQLKDYGTILTNESHQEQNEKIILSVEGEAEAKNLSKNKELEEISEIWSSSYVRAISTAKYIAERNSLKINIDSSLNERRLRRLSGIECIRRRVRPSIHNRTNA